MTVGNKPYISGFAMPDNAWLLGLAAGLNFEYENGLVATAGGTKAAALQIASGKALVAFATVATDADSALLPAAKAGTVVAVYNGGAHTLDLYGKGVDTINDVATATAYQLATTKAALFFCAKDGNWAAVKTA